MKKLKNFRLFSILLVISGIIGLITGTAVGAALGLLGIPIGLVMYFIFRGKLRKLCTKCGTSLSGCEFSYEETWRGYSSQSSNVPEVRVAYEAVCPECGHIKKFDKKFTISGQNLDRSARKYAEKYFR